MFVGPLHRFSSAFRHAGPTAAGGARQGAKRTRAHDDHQQTGVILQSPFSPSPSFSFTLTSPRFPILPYRLKNQRHPNGPRTRVHVLVRVDIVSLPRPAAHPNPPRTVSPPYHTPRLNRRLATTYDMYIVVLPSRTRRLRVPSSRFLIPFPLYSTYCRSLTAYHLIRVSAYQFEDRRTSTGNTPPQHDGRRVRTYSEYIAKRVISRLESTRTKFRAQGNTSTTAYRARQERDWHESINRYGENTKAERFASENIGKTVTQNTTIWKTREPYERIVETRPHRGRHHPYDRTSHNPTCSPEDVLALPVRSAGTPPGGASGPSATTSWRLARTGQCRWILTRLPCKTS